VALLVIDLGYRGEDGRSLIFAPVLFASFPSAWADPRRLLLLQEYRFSL
jgi:hypothetical protein